MIKLSLNLGIPYPQLSKMLSVQEVANYIAYDKMHPIPFSMWQVVANFMALYASAKTGKEWRADQLPKEMYPGAIANHLQSDDEIEQVLMKAFGVKKE